MKHRKRKYGKERKIQDMIEKEEKGKERKEMKEHARNIRK